MPGAVRDSFLYSYPGSDVLPSAEGWDRTGKRAEPHEGGQEHRPHGFEMTEVDKAQLIEDGFKVSECYREVAVLSSEGLRRDCREPINHPGC